MIRPYFLKFVLTLSIGLIVSFDIQHQVEASPYGDAFNRRINNPGDTDTLGEFVKIAVNTGQYDQALSTIEQHLISNPRDAEARLIAGRLYFHVGSYDLARNQVNAALSIGTLSPNKRDEAEELIQRIEKHEAGNTGYVSLTTGAEVVHTNYASTAAISDRTDFNPYGEIYAILRHDLNTPTNDAIIISARARVSRLFGDFNLSGSGGVFTAAAGRVSIAWDRGLPDSGIASLRMNFKRLW